MASTARPATAITSPSTGVVPEPTPWDEVDEERLDDSLREIFRIDDRPRLDYSYKPYVLLFDEYYTELYRIGEAQRRMLDAERMVFIGTSFSVNITHMALEVARTFMPFEMPDAFRRVSPITIRRACIRPRPFTATPPITRSRRWTTYNARGEGAPGAAGFTAASEPRALFLVDRAETRT